MKKFLAIFFSLVLVSCSGKQDDAGGSEMTEPAQQIGDVMASIDEVGGTSGAIAASAFEKESRRTFVRLAPEELNGNIVSKLFVKSAEAFTCDSNVVGHVNGGFSSCSSHQITRTFGGCTVGTGQDITFNGTVVFTWTTAGTCNISNTGERVDRSPNFTVTGRRGANLTVSKDATYGQRMTLTSTTGVTPKVYSLASDGIRRKFVTAGGVTTFDYITTVTSPVTVTGEARTGRVMNGGTIRVKDNLTGVTCDYSPVNVTWGSNSCNCPTQGTWQATCSDVKTASLVLTGCGTGDFTLGSESGHVTFDRCGN